MARRTKSDALATRHALLDAAELLFDEKGVSRTSLHDIAQAAGATRGAIYWHFKDKADLFNAMMERATAPLEQALFAPQDGDAHTPDIAAVYTAMVDALRRIATDDSLRRVMRIATHRVEYVQELGAVQARHLTIHRQWLARNRSVLERSFTARAAAPANAATAALGLQVLVEGLLQVWLLDTQAFDLEQAGRSTIATYLRGLGLAVPEGA